MLADQVRTDQGATHAAPPAPRFGNLRALPTSLLGRDNDLANARRLVLEEGVRLLALTGTAGVGKTRLGLAVAEMVLGSFPDGVRIVDLAAVSDSSRS